MCPAQGDTVAWGWSSCSLILPCLLEYESEKLVVKCERHCRKLCHHAETPGKLIGRSLKGTLLKEGETLEQLALAEMKSKSPIIAVRLTKEEKLPWVIPGCMNNEKKLSKGRVS